MEPTVYQAFATVAARLGTRPALLHKVNGRFRAITFNQLHRLVDETAAGLARYGLKPGMRVAIYSYNRPEWVIADLAAVKLGAVVVPVYHTLAPDAVTYILRDAGVSHLFIETPDLLNPLLPRLNSIPGLKLTVTFFEPTPPSARPEITPFSQLKQQGREALASTPELARAHPARPDDLLTICYTSGTTGEPRGAMLSHRNILSNVRAAIERFNVSDRDLLVSFLPLCHMFERTCGYYTMLLAGATIAYAESLQTIQEDVAAVRPTLLIVVPRVLEKVYAAVQEKILTGPLWQQILMRSTIKTLNRYYQLKSWNRRIPPGLAVKRKILDLLVARKLRQLGGGRIRLIVSGGAPLERKLARTIRSLGFNLVEGYGLTETSPVVCAAVPGQERVGTVGKPFPGVEVKIGPNDEILVRGPNVMLGYYQQPQATAEVIDADGWFHTGDQGRFDSEGNLIITGRIKEIIVNSYGKNIAPVPIEQALCGSKFIEQAVVIGDRRPYLVALIVPARLTLEDYARKNRVAAASYEELLNHPEIIALFRAEIDRLLMPFAPYEQVRKFRLIPEPFTVENGMLTPTLKIRRPEINRAFTRVIESLYQQD
ncbi:MAG: AMP-dependent synthetase/ligase [bacterium]|jgi:long-chain acyl-CoA synthetase